MCTLPFDIRFITKITRVCSCSFCFLDLHPKTLASSKAASSSPRYLVGQIHTGKCSFQLMLGSTCFNKIPIWVFQLINMLEIFKVSNVAKWISKLLNIPVGCNSKKRFHSSFLRQMDLSSKRMVRKIVFLVLFPGLSGFVSSWAGPRWWVKLASAAKEQLILKPLGLHIFT